MEDFNISITENNYTKTLSGASYTSIDIFEKERRYLFQTLPIMAAPACHFYKKGSYVITDIVKESIITVKGEDNTIRAMANTCRHRGKRLLEETSLNNDFKLKNLKSIVCPYHAWKYDLKGGLVGARRDESISLKSLCLRKLKVYEAGGLVFYYGSNEDAIPHLKVLDHVFSTLHLKDSQISATKRYSVKANWKLWTENFLECWHCAACHPELSEVKGFINQFENGREDLYVDDDINWRLNAQKKGWNPPEDVDFEQDKSMFHFNVSLPLGNNNLTASKNGKRLGPALGGAEGFEGGAIFGSMGPFLFYIAYVDYVVLFNVRPVSVEETNIDAFWLTSKNFNTSKEELMWLWDTTLKQDIKLVEESQQGVSSLYYSPGPFQADEYRTQAFTSWWKKWYKSKN